MVEHTAPIALITGATSGIGRELSIIFARHNFNLLLVARTEQSLHQFADELRRRYSIRCTTVACDLTQPTATDVISGIVQEQKQPIEILVNNAGFGNWGKFYETDLTTEIDEIQLNITSLVKLTKLILPSMIQRRSGKILNVASTAGFAPGPLMAIYYATKAFVVSFSEALCEELKGTGVMVSVLCPGETSTNFQKRAGIERTNLNRKEFVMDAATVAQDAFSGLMKGKPIIVPGLRNKLLVLSIRMAPRNVVRSVVQWFNKKR
jgi:short-subunit dehydrogenase